MAFQSLPITKSETFNFLRTLQYFKWSSESFVFHQSPRAFLLVLHYPPILFSQTTLGTFDNRPTCSLKISHDLLCRASYFPKTFFRSPFPPSSSQHFKKIEVAHSILPTIVPRRDFWIFPHSDFLATLDFRDGWGGIGCGVGQGSAPSSNLVCLLCNLP